ncbi:MAG: amino acid ABC transporter permease [Lachnospiraceae bacterium]|nr:amino acid ABC transporter permease [Lachnospiraceae bacterium]
MNERILDLLITSFPRILVMGLKVTIPLTLLAFAAGLFIALVVAMIRELEIPVLSQICKLYVWIFRGTPLLVQLFIIFFGLPAVGITLDAFPAAVIAFSLNEGAYTSEIMRGAISAIPRGQYEAGYSVGMNYFQIMRRIVLPQAFRVAFPPLFNELIALVKNTSLAASITVSEMFREAQKIAARTFEPVALYCEVALIYLIICTVLTRLQVYGEKRLSAFTGKRKI